MGRGLKAAMEEVEAEPEVKNQITPPTHNLHIKVAPCLSCVGVRGKVPDATSIRVMVTTVACRGNYPNDPDRGEVMRIIMMIMMISILSFLCFITSHIAFVSSPLPLPSLHHPFLPPIPSLLFLPPPPWNREYWCVPRTQINLCTNVTCIW